MKTQGVNCADANHYMPSPPGTPHCALLSALAGRKGAAVSVVFTRRGAGEAATAGRGRAASLCQLCALELLLPLLGEEGLLGCTAQGNEAAGLSAPLHQ